MHRSAFVSDDEPALVTAGPRSARRPHEERGGADRRSGRLRGQDHPTASLRDRPDDRRVRSDREVLAILHDLGLAFIQRAGPDSCAEALAPLHPSMYLRVRVAGIVTTGSRLAYRLAWGRLPPMGRRIAKTCRTPSCIHPGHVFVKAAGQSRKLSLAKAAEIRKAHRRGLPVQTLAAMYGVGRWSIYSIIGFRSWKPTPRQRHTRRTTRPRN
jgi:hypothetical protein